MLLQGLLTSKSAKDILGALGPSLIGGTLILILIGLTFPTFDLFIVVSTLSFILSLLTSIIVTFMMDKIISSPKGIAKRTANKFVNYCTTQTNLKRERFRPRSPYRIFTSIVHSSFAKETETKLTDFRRNAVDSNKNTTFAMINSKEIRIQNYISTMIILVLVGAIAWMGKLNLIHPISFTKTTTINLPMETYNVVLWITIVVIIILAFGTWYERRKLIGLFEWQFPFLLTEEQDYSLDPVYREQIIRDLKLRIHNEEIYKQILSDIVKPRQELEKRLRMQQPIRMNIIIEVSKYWIFDNLLHIISREYPLLSKDYKIDDTIADLTYLCSQKDFIENTEKQAIASQKIDLLYDNENFRDKLLEFLYDQKITNNLKIIVLKKLIEKKHQIETTEKLVLTIRLNPDQNFGNMALAFILIQEPSYEIWVKLHKWFKSEITKANDEFRWHHPSNPRMVLLNHITHSVGDQLMNEAATNLVEIAFSYDTTSIPQDIAKYGIKYTNHEIAESFFEKFEQDPEKFNIHQALNLAYAFNYYWVRKLLFYVLGKTSYDPAASAINQFITQNIQKSIFPELVSLAIAWNVFPTNRVLNLNAITNEIFNYLIAFFTKERDEIMKKVKKFDIGNDFPVVSPDFRNLKIPEQKFKINLLNNIRDPTSLLRNMLKNDVLAGKKAIVMSILHNDNNFLFNSFLKIVANEVGNFDPSITNLNINKEYLAYAIKYTLERAKQENQLELALTILENKHIMFAEKAFEEDDPTRKIFKTLSSN